MMIDSEKLYHPLKKQAFLLKKNPTWSVYSVATGAKMILIAW